jgi:glutathione S-transferase
MIELYQAEWCPHSHRVRERLTELGLDFVARQVASDPGERAQMQQATGNHSIPTLVDGARVLVGDEAILGYLDAAYEEPPTAAAHREKDADEGPAWRG